MSPLHTPVCDLLGCDVPIVLAGMGGVARSELAAAVCRAGGFGLLGMVREPPELVRAEIAAMRANTDRPFGVSLIPAATPPKLLEQELQVCLEERVPAVALFWDLSAEVVGRLRAAGIQVLCQVGSLDEARAAAAAGADVVILQGLEAGGHVRARAPLSEVAPAVVAALDVPVLLAGGIADGRDIARALRWGAQGVVVGTAFLATEESFAHAHHKARVVAAQPGEALLTEAFHINWPPNAPVRVLPNAVTRGERGDPYGGGREVIGHEGERPIYLFSTDSPLRDMTGELDAMAIYAGEGAGRLAAVVPAAVRMKALVDEAVAALGEASDRSQS